MYHIETRQLLPPIGGPFGSYLTYLQILPTKRGGQPPPDACRLVRSKAISHASNGLNVIAVVVQFFS